MGLHTFRPGGGWGEMAVSAKRIWISEFEGTSPTADNANAGDIILRPERDGVFAEVRGSLAAVLEGADGLTNGAGRGI